MAEADHSPQLSIERIYVRDASFESPKAPDVFAIDWQPKVQVDINTRNSRLSDFRHEVVLTLTIEAKIEDEVAMIVELQQAGIFRLQNMEDDFRAHVLATACPNALFPYARETLDSLVTKGTFPPFMLAPVNFDALYAEAKRRWSADQADNSFVN